MNNLSTIAAALLGEIDWQPAGFGYCTCPGASRHENRTGRRDTRVYIVGAPTIYCLHSSCAGDVADANHALRSAIGKASLGELPPAARRPVKTPEQLAREREQAAAARLAAQARNALPNILRDFAWSLAEIWHDSPGWPEDMTTDWRAMLSLFDPADVVWIGGLYDTGKPEHSTHFRTAAEWLSLSQCPAGPFVSPFTYQPGSFSRCAASIVRRRLLVVESDTLTKDEQGAILRWLREAAGLHLRAVVDTAGKSIHGSFEPPEDESTLKELAAVLPALGCDPAMLRTTQVSRLPSCRRGDKWQSLLFFDGGEAR